MLATCWIGFMWLAGSPKVSPSCAERYNAVPLISVPRHMSRTCSEPVSLCYAEPTISQTPTRRIWIGCSMLIPGCEPLGALSKSSTSSMKPTT